MNVSLWMGRLSLVGAVLTFAGNQLLSWKPQIAVYLLGIAVALNAFTERVQGGKSKQ